MRFDRELPAGGLLVYHVDDAQTTNSNEDHRWVGLMQADGLRHLDERGPTDKVSARGDAGDPFPGSGDNRSFGTSTEPSSRSYAGAPTGVSITEISESMPVMSARLGVSG